MLMNAYKFLVKDIYTNEKREFEYSSPNKDPRLVHKEGLKKIKYEEDIEKVYKTNSETPDKSDRLVYDKRKGFLD
jgi:hypothetical protein